MIRITIVKESVQHCTGALVWVGRGREGGKKNDIEIGEAETKWMISC